jgi:hypothetical protein
VAITAYGMWLVLMLVGVSSASSLVWDLGWIALGLGVCIQVIHWVISRYIRPADVSKDC